MHEGVSVNLINNMSYELKNDSKCYGWKKGGGSWFKSGSVESGGGAKTRPPLLSKEMR
jgi:hypothetical protein